MGDRLPPQSTLVEGAGRVRVRLSAKHSQKQTPNCQRPPKTRFVFSAIIPQAGISPPPVRFHISDAGRNGIMRHLLLFAQGFWN
jgi:hypothetical protein